MSHDFGCILTAIGAQLHTLHIKGLTMTIAVIHRRFREGKVDSIHPQKIIQYGETQDEGCDHIFHGNEMRAPPRANRSVSFSFFDKMKLDLTEECDSVTQTSIRTTAMSIVVSVSLLFWSFLHHPHSLSAAAVQCQQQNKQQEYYDIMPQPKI